MSRLVHYLLIFVLARIAKGSNCSKNCRPSLNGDVNCKSGGCDEGCLPGFFGKKCDERCSLNCKSVICAADDGTCSGGCKNNYCGDQCTRTCDAGLVRKLKATTTTREHSLVSSQDTSSVTDTTLHQVWTEIYKEGTSPQEPEEAFTTNSKSTATTQDSPPAASQGDTPDNNKILLYSVIGVAALVVNAVIICFLYFCVRRNFYRTNSRIEATHASIRVLELACIPQRPPEFLEVQSTMPNTSYLTATTAVKESVVPANEYDVIDSNDLEPALLLADCFDDFVPNIKTDALLSSSSEGKYIYGLNENIM